MMRLAIDDRCFIRGNAILTEQIYSFLVAFQAQIFLPVH